MSLFDLKNYMSIRQELVNQYLQERVPPSAQPAGRLYEAMNYSLAAGGKRLRPILTLASWEACRGEACRGGGASDSLPAYPQEVLAAACALEMIHTYSLIHDDLPAMDDDDLRRGKPTNHIAFGEATAILAGDSLLTEAFATLAAADTADPCTLLKVIQQIATASGGHGMAGGQVLDLQAEGQEIDLAALEQLHRYKTGCLIQVSCHVGGELAQATTEQLKALDRYGSSIGLAFQIADDVLDVEGGTEELGKTAGADAAHHKNTYVSVLGLEAAKKKARDQIDQALSALQVFTPAAEPLQALAQYIISRTS